MTVIDVIELLKKIQNPPYTIYNRGERCEWVEECIKNAPTITIPCCSDCILHGRCSIEDTYIDVGIKENERFCSIGKKRTEDKNENI